MVRANTTIETVNGTIPAVAYLRRSTDRQEQSIGDQRAEITRWAGENGYALIDEYLDDAISGTSADTRPGFQRMIADAKSGQFRAVIVWNSDRFSRGDVTETEHFRYLLRSAGVKVLSVTEDYLAREGIDGDVLRTVKQFQNRQFSISLSQNTLRGQISAVKAESDPGRPAPYGYDREIVGPDGSVLYRVRFCPGHIREVRTKDGTLQARYLKGQSLVKPGKECKARLVLSDPQRVETVRDIFRLCAEGWGFKRICEQLNQRHVPSPRGNLWAFTTIKAILANPAYCGDMVWNRRTEAKFYRVRDGRPDHMRPYQESAAVANLPKEEWIVIRDVVTPIVDRTAWEKAQEMAAKRAEHSGGQGMQSRRWLLSSVLRCGSCGSLCWGERKKKGAKPGHREIVTHYYTCGGRRYHGKSVCPTSMHVKAPLIEKWVLDKLASLVFAKAETVETAIERSVAAAIGDKTAATRADQIVKDIRDTDAKVKALLIHIEPENLPLINDRLSQLRRRKEHLEKELAAAQVEAAKLDADALRRWAKQRITGLADAMAGKRDERSRQVLSSYITSLQLTPGKSGTLVINPGAWRTSNDRTRPKGRVREGEIAGAGFDLTKAVRVVGMRYRQTA